MQHNEIYFAGYAGRDAEEITTASGVRIVKFSLCHTEKGRDGRGDISTWLEIVTFGTWCDLAATVRKGNNVMVKGKLQIRDWETKEGEMRQAMEVVTLTLGIFLRGERREAQQSARPSNSAQTSRSNPPPPRDQW
jgi:single-strand DNA-binding protein